MIEALPTQAAVHVSVTFPLRHVCPYRDEEDRGNVTITWRTGGVTLELHSLRAYLDQWADKVISHEEITDEINRTVKSLVGTEVAVHTTWSTAGGSVEVRGADENLASWLNAAQRSYQ